MVCAATAPAQVPVELTVSANGHLSVPLANQADGAVDVAIVLLRGDLDALKMVGAGDTVRTIITPNHFTLGAHQRRFVRVAIRELIDPTADHFRLAVTFTPRHEEVTADGRPVARLYVAHRVLVKLHFDPRRN